MKADKKIREEVLQILEEAKGAYLKQDVDGVMQHVSKDPDVIFVLTGQDEIYTGHSEVKKVICRDFDQAEGVKIESTSEPVVSASGNVAWLEMHGVARVKLVIGSLKILGRVTILFEKRDSNWLIMQVHFSVPALGQKKGQSFATGLIRGRFRRKKKRA